ncbi:hypothetical protein CLOP_g23487 [Closterium sp. NIES-67]|nr:hypothetical protein CLOP_g23487 [Closterium sp. NIES-67]
MSANHLQGPIPSTIGNLLKLTALNMSANLLAGTLPATLGSLSKLTLLDYDKKSLPCPNDGNCVVPQSSATVFCKSCPAFCAPCYGKGASGVQSSIFKMLAALVVVILVVWV